MCTSEWERFTYLLLFEDDRFTHYSIFGIPINYTISKRYTCWSGINFNYSLCTYKFLAHILFHLIWVLSLSGRKTFNSTCFNCYRNGYNWQYLWWIIKIVTHEIEGTNMFASHIWLFFLTKIKHIDNECIVVLFTVKSSAKHQNTHSKIIMWLGIKMKANVDLIAYN